MKQLIIEYMAESIVGRFLEKYINDVEICREKTVSLEIINDTAPVPRNEEGTLSVGDLSKEFERSNILVKLQENSEGNAEVADFYSNFYTENWESIQIELLESLSRKCDGLVRTVMTRDYIYIDLTR